MVVFIIQDFSAFLTTESDKVILDYRLGTAVSHFSNQLCHNHSLKHKIAVWN
jgi:hypothetical protein